LLVTERELVVISDEMESSEESPHKTPPAEEPAEGFGGIITFLPLVRLKDFHISQQDGFEILSLQASGAHGGEKLEIIFPRDEGAAVSKALEQMLFPRGRSGPTR
jgi:hypothetical protein